MGRRGARGRPRPEAARLLLVRDVIARQVARHLTPPRPVPWARLALSTMGAGVAVAVLFLGVLVAMMLDVAGLLGVVAWRVLGSLLLGGVMVDLVRLVRNVRVVRQGLLVSATVDAGTGRRTRSGARVSNRELVHPVGGRIRDRVRMPSEAPTGQVTHSVLVHPNTPRVWATLTRLRPLEPDPAPEGLGLVAGLPPLRAATAAGRWAAAWRAGYWCATIAVMSAAITSHRFDDPRWWLLTMGGPAGAAAAAARVGLRLDAEGVRLRSVLWTRRRSWAYLTGLGVSELLLLPGKHGGGITTPVLAFEDHLGARLRAVATVRCWERPWLDEVVRRCETAGLDIDEQLASDARW